MHGTIVEVVPDERRYVYRLAGTKEVAIRGCDPTGKPVIEGFFGSSLDDALDSARRMSLRWPLLG